MLPWCYLDALRSVKPLTLISNRRVIISRILFVILLAENRSSADGAGSVSSTRTSPLNARAAAVKRTTRWSPRGTAGTPQAAVCAAMSAQAPSSWGSGTWWVPPITACHSPNTHVDIYKHTIWENMTSSECTQNACSILSLRWGCFFITKTWMFTSREWLDSPLVKNKQTKNTCQQTYVAFIFVDV